MKTYEAMFVLDAGAGDFDAASAPVRDVLERAEAETLSIKPWDERRLAYEIKGRRRGLYVLTYFKADPARMDALEHDIQLDERILRAMILSASHVDEKTIQAETPATQAQARKTARDAEAAAKAAAEAAPAPAAKAAPAPAAEGETAAETPAAPAPAKATPPVEAPAPAAEGEAAAETPAAPAPAEATPPIEAPAPPVEPTAAPEAPAADEPDKPGE